MDGDKPTGGNGKENYPDVHDSFSATLVKYMDALEELVQVVGTLTRKVKDFCKMCEVYMKEAEYHDHKLLHKGLKKAMDVLTKRVRFPLEAYSQVNRGVAGDLYMLYELFKPCGSCSPGGSCNPGGRFNEKVQAAKEDIFKHVKDVRASVGFIEREVKKNEEFLHRKLTVDQKDMDYLEVVGKMRWFAESIENSFKIHFNTVVR